MPNSLMALKNEAGRSMACAGCLSICVFEERTRERQGNLKIV